MVEAAGITQSRGPKSDKRDAYGLAQRNKDPIYDLPGRRLPRPGSDPLR